MSASSGLKYKPSKKPILLATCFQAGVLLDLFLINEDGNNMAFSTSVDFQ
jgi:hypothetical protein